MSDASKKPLRFHEAARDDVREAFDWYAKQSEVAADAFKRAVEAAGLEIAHAPNRWAK